MSVASNITIGVLGGGGQQYLTGDVGAVWYYSSSLTAAQINQIYQSTKSRYSDPMPTVRRGLIMDLDASNQVLMQVLALFGMIFLETIITALFTIAQVM